MVGAEAGGGFEVVVGFFFSVEVEEAVEGDAPIEGGGGAEEEDDGECDAVELAELEFALEAVELFAGGEVEDIDRAESGEEVSLFGLGSGGKGRGGGDGGEIGKGEVGDGVGGGG